jgi:hypothetical protein
LSTDGKLGELAAYRLALEEILREDEKRYRKKTRNPEKEPRATEMVNIKVSIAYFLL